MVDAAIWVTVIDAGKNRNEVVLITNNTTQDFADPADKTKPHPLLVEDLAADGAIPGRIRSCASVASRIAAVISEIENAVEWFPLELGPQWQLHVEVHDSTMSEFNVSEVELARADPAPKGFYMTTMIARGVARLDLGIRKYDAYAIPDASPVQVYDWDWNESMVAAEAELPARLLVEILVEILVENGNLGVSLDAVEPASPEAAPAAE